MLAHILLLSFLTFWKCVCDEVYDVVYAGGQLDIINPHTRHGHYEMIFARFASNGSLLQTRNVTNNHSQMMSYVDYQLSQKSIVFSAQVSQSSDVAIFEVPFEATEERSMKQLIPVESLTKLCQSCTSASTFSASYASDGRIAFAFRVWNQVGEAIGNQAIGLIERNGTIRALTFAATPPFTSNTNSLETCPRFHPGDPSKLFYLRIHPDESTSLHMYDLKEDSTREILTPRGIYNDHPSCPEFSLDAHGLLFIDGVFQGHRAPQALQLWPLWSDPMQSGQHRSTESLLVASPNNGSHLVFAQFQGRYESVETKEVLADPLTHSWWARSLLTFTDCRPLSLISGDVACLDKYQNLVLLHDSEFRSGWTILKLPYTQTGWCKTNSCFQIHKHDLQNREKVVVV